MSNNWHSSSQIYQSKDDDLIKSSEKKGPECNRFIEYRPMLSIAPYSTAVVELRSGGRMDVLG